jgi:hypothetical protein
MYLVNEEFRTLWKKKTAFGVHGRIIKQAVMTAKQGEILDMAYVKHEWREKWVGVSGRRLIKSVS